MASKYIEKALGKCDKLPKELIKDMEKNVLNFDAGSAESVFKWHNENEVNAGDVVVELIYRVRVIQEDE